MASSSSSSSREGETVVDVSAILRKIDSVRPGVPVAAGSIRQVAKNKDDATKDSIVQRNRQLLSLLPYMNMLRMFYYSLKVPGTRLPQYMGQQRKKERMAYINHRTLDRFYDEQFRRERTAFELVSHLIDEKELLPEVTQMGPLDAYTKRYISTLLVRHLNRDMEAEDEDSSLLLLLLIADGQYQKTMLIVGYPLQNLPSQRDVLAPPESLYMATPADGLRPLIGSTQDHMFASMDLFDKFVDDNAYLHYLIYNDSSAMYQDISAESGRSIEMIRRTLDAPFTTKRGRRGSSSTGSSSQYEAVQWLEVYNAFSPYALVGESVTNVLSVDDDRYREHYGTVVVDREEAEHERDHKVVAGNSEAVAVFWLLATGRDWEFHFIQSPLVSETWTPLEYASHPLSIPVPEIYQNPLFPGMVENSGDVIKEHATLALAKTSATAVYAHTQALAVQIALGVLLQYSEETKRFELLFFFTGDPTSPERWYRYVRKGLVERIPVPDGGMVWFTTTPQLDPVFFTSYTRFNQRYLFTGTSFAQFSLEVQLLQEETEADMLQKTYIEVLIESLYPAHPSHTNTEAIAEQMAMNASMRMIWNGWNLGRLALEDNQGTHATRLLSILGSDRVSIRDETQASDNVFHMLYDDYTERDVFGVPTMKQLLLVNAAAYDRTCQVLVALKWLLTDTARPWDKIIHRTSDELFVESRPQNVVTLSSRGVSRRVRVELGAYYALANVYVGTARQDVSSEFLRELWGEFSYFTTTSVPEVVPVAKEQEELEELADSGRFEQVDLDELLDFLDDDVVAPPPQDPDLDPEEEDDKGKGKAVDQEEEEEEFFPGDGGETLGWDDYDGGYGEFSQGSQDSFLLQQQTTPAPPTALSQFDQLSPEDLAYLVQSLDGDMGGASSSSSSSLSFPTREELDALSDTLEDTPLATDDEIPTVEEAEEEAEEEPEEDLSDSVSKVFFGDVPIMMNDIGNAARKALLLMFYGVGEPVTVGDYARGFVPVVTSTAFSVDHGKTLYKIFTKGVSVTERTRRRYDAPHPVDPGRLLLGREGFVQFSERNGLMASMRTRQDNEFTAYDALALAWLTQTSGMYQNNNYSDFVRSRGITGGEAYATGDEAMRRYLLGKDNLVQSMSLAKPGTAREGRKYVVSGLRQHHSRPHIICASIRQRDGYFVQTKRFMHKAVNPYALISIAAEEEDPEIKKKDRSSQINETRSSFAWKILLQEDYARYRQHASAIDTIPSPRWGVLAATTFWSERFMLLDASAADADSLAAKAASERLRAPYDVRSDIKADQEILRSYYRARAAKGQLGFHPRIVRRLFETEGVQPTILPSKYLYNMIVAGLFYDSSRQGVDYGQHETPFVASQGIPYLHEFYAPITGYVTAGTDIIEHVKATDEDAHTIRARSPKSPSTPVADKVVEQPPMRMHMLVNSNNVQEKGFRLIPQVQMFLSGIEGAEAGVDSVRARPYPEWALRVRGDTVVTAHSTIGVISAQVYVTLLNLEREVFTQDELLPVDRYCWIYNTGVKPTEGSHTTYWMELDTRRYGNPLRYVRYTTEPDAANVQFTLYHTELAPEFIPEGVTTRYPTVRDGDLTVFQNTKFFSLTAKRDILAGQELLVYLDRDRIKTFTDNARVRVFPVREPRMQVIVG